MECVVVIENLNLSKVEPLVSHWIRENVEKYKDCVVVCPDENGIRKVNRRTLLRGKIFFKFQGDEQ